MIKDIKWNTNHNRKDTMVMGLCFLADGLIRVFSLGKLWSVFAYKRALYDCKTNVKNVTPEVRTNMIQHFKDIWCKP